MSFWPDMTFSKKRRLDVSGRGTRIQNGVLRYCGSSIQTSQLCRQQAVLFCRPSLETVLPRLTLPTTRMRSGGATPGERAACCREILWRLFRRTPRGICLISRGFQTWGPLERSQYLEAPFSCPISLSSQGDRVARLIRGGAFRFSTIASWILHSASARLKPAASLRNTS